MTGGSVLCATIPTLVLGPVAGVYVDLWNKQHLMIWMDSIRAALILLLLVVALPLPFVSGNTLPAIGKIVIVYSVIVLTTCCSLFFNPARLTIIRHIVDNEQLERASGLALLAWDIARITGPSLAAPFLFVFGIQWALLLNALSFVVSACAVRWVRTDDGLGQTNQAEQKPHGGFWHEFGEGLSFLLKSRVIMNPLMLRTIPKELLGRVMAVFSTWLSVATILSVIALSSLASALSGFHTSLLGLAFGVYDTIFTFCGILNMLIGVGVMFAFKRIPLETKQPE